MGRAGGGGKKHQGVKKGEANQSGTEENKTTKSHRKVKRNKSNSKLKLKPDIKNNILLRGKIWQGK